MYKLYTKKDKNFYVYLGNNKAVNLHKKNLTANKHGVIAVKTKDGQLHTFSTEMQKEIALVIGVEMDVAPIEFKDDYLNRQWDQVFGFLFDGDSAMLFLGERFMATQIGIYKLFAESYEVHSLKKVAFHVSAFMGQEVQDIVLSLDNDSSDDVSDEMCFMIEQGGAAHEYQ